MRADADSLVNSIVLIDATSSDGAQLVVEDGTAPQNAPASLNASPPVASLDATTSSTTGSSGLSGSSRTAPGSSGRGRSVAVSIVGTVVLFLALTLHSFLAGLVLGIGGSMEAGVFIAVIAHKSFAAWALGCALARQDKISPCHKWLWLLGFSLTTPTGIAIGMGLSAAAWVDSTEQHALIALAAGFFLYVGLMEIAAKEIVDYHTKGSGIFAGMKLLMLVLGFVLMALLGLWV